MQTVKKFGLKFFVYIVLLALMLVFSTYYFVVQKTINFPTFLILAIGSIAFVYVNVIDRRKDMKLEEMDSLSKAEEEVQRSEWNNAIALYDKVLLYNPKSLKAMMGRAFALKEKAAYKDAITQYDEVIKLKGGFYTVFFLQGVCYLRDRQFKNSEEVLSKAIQAKPDFSEPYIFLGDLYYTINNEEKAQKYYEEYIKRVDNEILKALAQEKIHSIKNRQERRQMMEERKAAIERGEEVQAIDTMGSFVEIDTTAILDTMVSHIAKLEKAEDYKGAKLSKNDVLKALKDGLTEKERAEVFRILKIDMGVDDSGAKAVVHDDKKVTREERDELMRIVREESGFLTASENPDEPKPE
jgi:tetratricopeptide (TPR) repeat protein